MCVYVSIAQTDQIEKSERIKKATNARNYRCWRRYDFLLHGYGFLCLLLRLLVADVCAAFNAELSTLNNAKSNQ
jgi:hypothetical protein